MLFVLPLINNLCLGDNDGTYLHAGFLALIEILAVCWRPRCINTTKTDCEWMESNRIHRFGLIFFSFSFFLSLSLSLICYTAHFHINNFQIARIRFKKVGYLVLKSFQYPDFKNVFIPNDRRVGDSIYWNRSNYYIHA